MNALEVIDALCDLMEGLEGRFDWGKDEEGIWLDIISDATQYGIRYHTSNVDVPGMLYKAQPKVDYHLRRHLRGVIGWLEEHHAENLDKFRPYTPSSVAFRWNKRGSIRIDWRVENKHQSRFTVNKDIPEIAPTDLPFLHKALSGESEDGQ